VTLGDKPTPRGERPRVPQARLAGDAQSAWRDMRNVHRPISQRLFGGIQGRQARAAG